MGETYSTVVYYDDNYQYHNPDREKRRTERYLSGDTLYIFFENGFDLDTVDIKINNQKKKTLYLDTDQSLGLANGGLYYYIIPIDKIEISKNCGSPLKINLYDKTMNLWTVNFHEDTLRAQRRKYLPLYE